MKALYFIIVLAIFAGCSPCERLARRCPPNVVIKDSLIIKETIKYRPRFIYDTIPGDTVRVERIVKTEIPIDIDQIQAENKYARAEAGVTGSRLWLELQQKNQVITHILDSADREVTYWKEMYRDKDSVIMVTQKYIPKLHRVALIYSICLTAGVAIYITIRIKSKGLLERIFSWFK
jgi:hypothetical protein